MKIFSKRCIFCEEYFRKSDCEYHSRFLCVCLKCSAELENQNVHDIVDTPPPLSRVIPITYYTEPVRRAIRQFKFCDNRGYGKLFSDIAEERLCKIWDLFQFDAIVTIPLSDRRMKERGYNQSSFLAETAERVLGISRRDNYLTRTLQSGRQSNLSYHERVINIQGAYTASNEVRDKNILLIDDICTSGSTIHEAALTLRNAGAKTIMAVVFAAVPPKKQKNSRYIDI